MVRQIMQQSATRRFTYIEHAFILIAVNDTFTSSLILRTCRILKSSLEIMMQFASLCRSKTDEGKICSRLDQPNE